MRLMQHLSLYFFVNVYFFSLSVVQGHIEAAVDLIRHGPLRRDRPRIKHTNRQANGGHRQDRRDSTDGGLDGRVRGR